MNELLNWLADEADDGKGTINFDSIYEFARRQVRSDPYNYNRPARAFLRWYDERWPIPDDRLEEDAEAGLSV